MRVSSSLSALPHLLQKSELTTFSAPQLLQRIIVESEAKLGLWGDGVNDGVKTIG